MSSVDDHPIQGLYVLSNMPEVAPTNRVCVVDRDDVPLDEDLVVAFRLLDQVIHIEPCEEVGITVWALPFEEPVWVVVAMTVLVMCDVIREVDWASTVTGYLEIWSEQLSSSSHEMIQQILLVAVAVAEMVSEVCSTVVVQQEDVEILPPTKEGVECFEV